jgi:hypothetical protein
MRKARVILTVIAVSFLMVAGSLLSIRGPGSQSVHLTNGTTLRIVAIQTGPRFIDPVAAGWEKFLTGTPKTALRVLRIPQPPELTPFGGLTNGICLTLSTAGGRVPTKHNAERYLITVSSPEEASDFGPGSSIAEIQYSESLVYQSYWFPTFPRRSRELLVNVMDTWAAPGPRLLHSFKIPNPLHTPPGRFATHAPAVPASQLSIKASHIASAEQLGGPFALALLTSMDVNLLESDKPTTNWEITDSATLGDAGGNRLPWSMRIDSFWDGQTNRLMMSHLRLPRSDSWILDLSVRKTNGFLSSELWTLPPIAIPSAPRLGTHAEWIHAGTRYRINSITPSTGTTPENQFVGLGIEAVGAEPPVGELRLIHGTDETGTVLPEPPSRLSRDQKILIEAPAKARELRLILAPDIHSAVRLTFPAPAITKR